MTDPERYKSHKLDRETMRKAWFWCTLQDICDKGYVIFIVISVLFLLGFAIYAIVGVIGMFFDGRGDTAASILIASGLMIGISWYMIRSNDKTQGLYKDKKNKEKKS